MYYTISEFLELYPMGRSTFYRLVKTHSIRLTKFGGSSRVAKVDAEAWAASLPVLGGEMAA
jgi:excisionase family DNA binding protein